MQKFIKRRRMPGIILALIFTLYTMLMPGVAYAQNENIILGVAISGTPQIGQTLTADCTPAVDEAQLSYQWYSLNNISDTTSAGIQVGTGKNYTLTENESNKYLVVQATQTVVGADAVTVISAPLGVIAPEPSTSPSPEPSTSPSPEPTTEPTAPTASGAVITGSPVVGQILTGQYQYGDADNDPESGSVYHWYRCETQSDAGTLIQDANGISYTPVADDLNKYIKFEVIPQNDSDPKTGQPNKSEALGPIASPQPTEPVPPTASDVHISGDKVVGGMLTGNYTYSDLNGNAENGSIYHWYRCDAIADKGVEITGACDTTYTLTTDDIGKYIRFEVTPKADTDPQLGAVYASDPIGPVPQPVTQPVLSDASVTGKAQVGEALNVTYTTTGDDSQFTFQWYAASTRDQQGDPISNATGRAYILTENELGKFIKVLVTPIVGGITGVPVLSSSSDIVIPAPPPPAAPTVSEVEITGYFSIGQTLTGSYKYEDVNNDQEKDSSYQWYRCDVTTDAGIPITGATGMTYTLAGADFNKYIRFEVTPRSDVDPKVGLPVISAAVGKILNINLHPSISGVVRNSVDDSPIAGAAVYLSYNNISVVTDSNGYYEFNDIPAGTYQISAYKDYYYNRTIYNLPTQGSYGPSVVQNICLTPYNTPVQSVYGYIYDASNLQRVGNIRVDLGDGMTYYSDNYYWQTGYYRIDNVPVGKLFKMTIGSNSGYKVRHIDGIKAGDSIDVGLFNNWAAAGTITGSVTDSVTGNPIPGVRLRAGYGIEAVTDINGNYRLENIGAGTYYIQAFKTAYESSTTAVILTDGGNLTQDFKIQPNIAAGCVYGYVMNMSGSRLNGARVTIGGQTVITQASPGSQGDNGWYCIQGLVPGKYTMEVSDDYYHTRTTNTIAVGTSGQYYVNMRLTQLNTPTVTLSGVIRNSVNGNTITGAAVTVMDGVSVMADNNGNYSIPDIPPNNYAISASQTGYSNRYISRFPVTLDQGSTVIQDIGLTPNDVQTQSIWGYVVDANNTNKLNDVRVDLGNGMFYYTSDGYYYIDYVPTGMTYTIKANASGYKCHTVTGVKAGDVMDLALVDVNTTAGIVNGRVTDSETGAPISGAWIKAGYGLTAVTDSEGNYILDNLKPGDYYAMAFKSSYESSTSLVNISDGSTTNRDFTIKYNPSAVSVWGHVYNGSGYWINGAKVTMGGQTVYTQTAPGNPYDNGWYRIEGVAPGSYKVEASDEYYVTRTVDAVIAPGSVSSMVNIVMSQSKVSTVTLSGTVKDSVTGNPIPGANITIADGMTVLSDSNGFYKITDIPEGTYNINAYHAGFYQRSINSVPINAGSVSSITLDIGMTSNNIQSHDIYGYVIDADNSNKLNGIKVSIGDGLLSYTSGGYYYISNVPDGQLYTINAEPDSGYKPRSVSGIKAGDQMDFALLKDQASGGSITGKVVNSATGSGVAGVRIRAGYGIETISDSQGNYTLEDLVDGTYYIMAYIDGYESSSDIVSISGSDNVTQDFSIKPNSSAGYVYGSIYNQYGWSINGAKVTIDGKTVLTQTAPGSYGNNGWFCIQGIAIGNQSITISLPGYNSAVGTVYVNPSSGTYYYTYLQPGGNSSQELNADQITITNNLIGTDDLVKVVGISSGDVINVYDSPSGGSLLGSATAEGTTTVVKIPQIGLAAGTLYVTLTNPGRNESNRTAREFDGEAYGKSEKPLPSSIYVINNPIGTSDLITVSNLLEGDIVKIYDSSYGGNIICSGTVADHQTSIVFQVDQLPGVSFGSVYVTVTNSMMTESDRTQKTYLYYGDVDGNGSLTNSDLILVRRYFANVIKTLPNILAADVNGDGFLTNTDLILIRRYFANVITKFPAQP